MTRIAMKTVKSAKVNIFWAFVVASVCLQVTYSIKWKKYVHSMEFDGQVCAKEQVLFHEENVFFQVTCGTMCIMNSECAGVSYQSETHTCIGCREALDLFRGQNERFPGSSHFTRKQIDSDCLDIQRRNSSSTNGVYEITRGNKKMKVMCDMENGGYIVLQNRFDGSMDFYRNFSEYEHGFGNLSGEHWLGLENIREVAIAPNDFLFYYRTKNGKDGFVPYSDFKVMSSPEYRFNITDVEGMPENHAYASFTMFNGMAFSTFDRDMDSSSKQNCAKETDGAWWYDDCSGTSSQSSNLNSIYCIMGFRCELDGRAIDPIYTFHYRYTLLARSKLMVRRKSIK